MNEGAYERVLAVKDALTHPHCAHCTALKIAAKREKVELDCAVHYSPEGLWLDHTRPMGQEPECLGFQEIVDPPTSA